MPQETGSRLICERAALLNTRNATDGLARLLETKSFHRWLEVIAT